MSVPPKNNILPVKNQKFKLGFVKIFAVFSLPNWYYYFECQLHKEELNNLVNYNIKVHKEIYFPWSLNVKKQQNK